MLKQPMTRTAGGRPPWVEIRDRTDLVAVATDLLGPPPKRSGRRLLWRCPFHDDLHPSFYVDPQTQRWRCYPCDKGGDAPALLMAIERIGFAEAVGRLAIRSGCVARPSPRPAPRAEGPSGLSAADAIALVEESAHRIAHGDGDDALKYLITERFLAWETIRQHRLGWTPPISVPSSQPDRCFRVTGIVIPWFDGDRLSMVKVRREGDVKPKYIDVFRDRPTVYPGYGAIRPRTPLLAVEGEFDAMLLGQELGDRASVITLGGASARPDDRTRIAMSLCPERYAAHDADIAGDRAAAAWSINARRVRPPAGKDWTDARAQDIDLRSWWSQVLESKT